MKRHRLYVYIVAGMSLVAVAAYYCPWYVGANRVCLGFYILAFLWFLVAWIFVLLHLVAMVLHAKKREIVWKHHLTAALIVVSCYVAIVIGMMNNYMVTF